MSANRYLNAILTIIALELGWLALGQAAAPVSAQQAVTPVVITGVDLRADSDQLPVVVRGPVDIRATNPVPIVTTRPIEVFIPVVTSPVPGIN